MDRKTYTIPEVMELLHCSRRFLEKLINQRMFLPMRLGERKRLISTEQVSAYLEYAQVTPMIVSRDETVKIFSQYFSCTTRDWVTVAVCDSCRGNTWEIVAGGGGCQSCGYSKRLLYYIAEKHQETVPLAYVRMKKILEEK